MTEQENREQRNTVFAPVQQVGPGGVPTMSALEMYKLKFGGDIPVETIPLPSTGKIYPEGSPLHGREYLEVTRMTVKEEEILSNRNYAKKGTAITELIRSC